MLFLSLVTGSVQPLSASDRLTEQQAWQFALANLEFTLLHEMGHVLLDEFYVPVLGNEEDIADRIGVIATYLMHANLDDPAFANSLASILQNWRAEWEIRKQNQSEPAYWGQHPLEIQRYYDIVCLLYGSNPDVLEGFRETTGLPHERAMHCEKEYQQARRGLRWLATTFGDPRNAGGKPLRGHVEVVYQRSFLPNGDEIIERVKASGILEKAGRLVSAVYRLPRTITISLAGCGQDDAYWNPVSAQIVICHELVDAFLRRGRASQRYHVE